MKKKAPTEAQLAAALDELAVLRERLTAVAQERETLISQQPGIDALTGQISALNGEIADYEEFIRDGVLTAEKTVKGGRLMAVYAQGRTSWDGKKLDGYAAAHPEILDFRKTGSPTVSIRRV